MQKPLEDGTQHLNSPKNRVSDMENRGLLQGRRGAERRYLRTTKAGLASLHTFALGRGWGDRIGLDGAETERMTSSLSRTFLLLVKRLRTLQSDRILICSLAILRLFMKDSENAVAKEPLETSSGLLAFPIGNESVQFPSSLLEACEEMHRRP